MINYIKNILLLIFSIFLCFFFIEIILKFFGPYNHLANTKLISSLSWYERPHNFKQIQPHPDLFFFVNNYFDNNGIKTCDEKENDQKNYLIGIFGDSFVENINIDKKFEFSCLINLKLKKYKLINFGVGGYNFEQAFARYIKYQNYNFKYVFYLFYIRDQEGIGLMDINQKGDLVINKPKKHFLNQLISRLNISYFFLDLYYFAKKKLTTYHYVGRNNFPIVLSNYLNNFLFKNKYYDDKNFKKKLLKFNQLSNLNGAEFIVLIYPEQKHLDYFNYVMGEEINNIHHYILDEKLGNNKDFFFKNDGHWNEKGNVFLATNLLDIFNRIGIDFKNYNFGSVYNEIENFYLNNKKK